MLHPWFYFLVCLASLSPADGWPILSFLSHLLLYSNLPWPPPVSLSSLGCWPNPFPQGRGSTTAGMPSALTISGDCLGAVRAWLLHRVLTQGSLIVLLQNILMDLSFAWRENSTSPYMTEIMHPSWFWPGSNWMSVTYFVTASSTH